MLQHLFRLFSTGLLLIMSNQILANDLWIDVRTAEEFHSGHVQGAAHMPFEEIAARISEVTTDKDATLRLYCRTGRRSGIALETLQAMGFHNATNEGGYEEVLQKLTPQ